MTNPEPPTSPLVLVMFGVIVGAFAVVIPMIDPDAALAKVFTAALGGIAAVLLLIGCIGTGVELGMKRANFKR